MTLSGVDPAAQPAHLQHHTGAFPASERCCRRLAAWRMRWAWKAHIPLPGDRGCRALDGGRSRRGTGWGRWGSAGDAERGASYRCHRPINSIEINLTTQDKTEREAIVGQIQNEVGRYYAINALTDASSLLTSLGTAQAVIELLGILTLFMGGFIIFNTFRTIVAERRHDIGMLRAIGANRMTIVGLILVEGLLQGVVGTALGLAVGYGLALLVTVVGSLYQRCSVSA
jgi:hypothetical protein